MELDPGLIGELTGLSKDFEKDIIKIRRQIHQNPELSYEEKETSRLVAETLGRLGIKVRENVGGTGVIGILEGAKPGKTVALRADMDALPLQELTGESFSSSKQGIMHACGHDTHVAMLLGAAMILSKLNSRMSGTVKFIFQPAEEDGERGGALPMIEDGALVDPKPDYFFGIHISADYGSGILGIHGGAFMARPDAFRIRIIGRGGHGSQPSGTIDPIFAGVQIINSVYAFKSRTFDPRKPLTISFCTFHSGTKDNIIPDEAVIEGTIRTLDEEFRKKVLEQFNSTVEQTAKTYGAKVEIQMSENSYPVTVNDEEVSGRLFREMSKIEEFQVVDAEPRMGAEDVSRFLQKIPGTFYYLGTYNQKKGCTYPNHSSRFKVDEDVLRLGALAHAASVMAFSS